MQQYALLLHFIRVCTVCQGTCSGVSSIQRVKMHHWLCAHNIVKERSGPVLDSRPRGRGFEPHWRHCVVSSSKNINPSLVPVHSRKTRPFITESLLMGHKESNQTKQYSKSCVKRPLKNRQYNDLDDKW